MRLNLFPFAPAMLQAPLPLSRSALAPRISGSPLRASRCRRRGISPASCTTCRPAMAPRSSFRRSTKPSERTASALSLISSSTTGAFAHPLPSSPSLPIGAPCAIAILPLLPTGRPCNERRCADEQDENGVWNLYGDDIDHEGNKINWGKWAITGDDPDFQGQGNPDTGDDYGAAPDLDHLNPELRAALINWMSWLKGEVQCCAHQLDVVAWCLLCPIPSWYALIP